MCKRWRTSLSASRKRLYCKTRKRGCSRRRSAPKSRSTRSRDGVLTTDTLGNISYLNRVAEEMTGWPWQDASGRPLAEVFSLIDSATRQPVRNLAEQAVQQDEIVGLDLHSVLIRRDGHEAGIEESAAPIHDRHGRVVGAVLVFHDVGDSRATALKMSHHAQHDYLTGLPNRLLLTDRLTQAIALSRRHGNKVALLFLDLDHFKLVNDSLGHVIGDKLLQSVAQRLTASVRTSDTICRLGGDEFVVLLSEIEHVDAATHCAEKLGTAVAVTPSHRWARGPCHRERWYSASARMTAGMLNPCSRMQTWRCTMPSKWGATTTSSSRKHKRRAPSQVMATSQGAPVEWRQIAVAPVAWSLAPCALVEDTARESAHDA